MKQSKDKKEIQALTMEFEQLTSIQDKLDFWKNRLDFLYIHKEILFEDDFRFGNFEILPRNSEDMEALNLKCLDLTIESRKNSRNRPIDSEILIKNYQRDITEVKNKEFLKESTLEWIHDIVKEKKNPELIIDKERNEYFLKAYEDYIFDSIEPNYSNEIIDFDIAYELNNGCELAKYHEYVVKSKIPKPKNITNDIQLLMLEYLGVGEKIDDTTKKAVLYSKIIDKSQETTNQKLSNIDEGKSLENLNYLRKLFMEVGLTEQLRLVENDLKELLK